MASELIIGLLQPNESYTYLRFNNIPAPRSVFMVILSTESQHALTLAADLQTDIVQTLQKLEPNCNSNSAGSAKSLKSLDESGVMNDPNFIKLLIGVTDGDSKNFRNQDFSLWHHLSLPVLEAGVLFELEDPFREKQAVRWNNNISDVVPTVLGLMGVTPEDRKIFISYRQKDSYTIAQQLYDHLHRKHFDVFLDWVSIPPGINFQERLYQELMDKSVVVFIESEEFSDSEWVQLEVAFAKKYRLGVMAININQSEVITSVDEEYRINVDHNDIIDEEKGRKDLRKITTARLEQVLSEIEKHHATSLFRKKNFLNSSIAMALRKKRLSCTFDPNGFIDVKVPNGMSHTIKATPRPPQVKDYHQIDRLSNASKNVMIGPQFMENDRSILNKWLSHKSSVQYYHESQLLTLVNNL